MIGNTFHPAMIYLLDASVLIALVVQDHIFREAATAFFKQIHTDGWATCPLTENALIRIVGGSEIPGRPRSLAEIRDHFLKYLALPGHQFWPDDLSLMETRTFPILPGAKDVTDIYLLALAVKHGGLWATFVQRMDPAILPGGPATYLPHPHINRQPCPPARKNPSPTASSPATKSTRTPSWSGSSSGLSRNDAVKKGVAAGRQASRLSSALLQRGCCIVPA